MGTALHQRSTVDELVAAAFEAEGPVVAIGTPARRSPPRRRFGDGPGAARGRVSDTLYVLPPVRPQQAHSRTAALIEALRPTYPGSAKRA